MQGWAKAVGGWLLGNSLLLMPSMALAQTTTVPDSIEPIQIETVPAEVTPEEVTPEEATSESDEVQTEPDDADMPDANLEINEERLWTWPALANGTHLISSSPDPDAELEMFAFFDKENDYIWGVRFVSHPDAVPTCFQGRVQDENGAVESLSAVFASAREWYFNDAPLDFSSLPYRLDMPPSDWALEQVTEQINRCRGVLAPIQIDRERTLVLGVLSYLPLDRVRTLPDGSYFNEYEFNGRSGQRVRISSVSDDFDTYLILLNADGTTVASNDDFDGDKNAEINVELGRTGRYRVIANTYDFLGEGAFMLTITTGE